MPSRHYLALTLGLLAAVIGAHHAWAGAWVQPEGTAYVRASVGLLETDERYDADGNVVPFNDAGGFRQTDYRDLEGILYFEVGIHRDWTALGTVMLKSLQATQNSAIFETRGFGDGMLGLKRKLWQRPGHVGATSVQVRFPTGYDVADFPSLGAGVTEVQVFFQAGTSSAAAWGNLDTFFNFRGGDFRNQVGAVLAGGANPHPRLALRGSASGVLPVGTISDVNAVVGGIQFDPNAVDATYLDLSGVVGVGVGAGLGLEFEVRSTVAGKNTLRGTRFSFAVASNPAFRLWRPGS